MWKHHVRLLSQSIIISSTDISTDEDPSLRMESSATLKLRGVSTNYILIYNHHAVIQGTYRIVELMSLKMSSLYQILVEVCVMMSAKTSRETACIQC